MELVIQLYQYRADPSDHFMKVRAKAFRQHEINVCFMWNLNNPIIEKIHILVEKQEDIQYYTDLIQKYTHRADYTFHVFGKQPLYADLVRYVNDTIPPNKIVCIQNSDVYFSHDIQPDFLKEAVKEDTVVTLTRHEEQNPATSVFHHNADCNETTCPLIYNYMGSHDSFLFRTPVPTDFPYKNVEVPQNIFGGEAVFLKAWKDTGKKLINPCFDIKIIHKHNQRVYFKEYQTIADGYLANANPIAPKDRPDIEAKLKTIFPSHND